MPTANNSDIISIILGAGPMVRTVMLLLLVFSITSWAIIFAKYKTIRKAAKESSAFLNLFWNTQSLADVYASSKQLQTSPIAQMFRAAYTELKKINKARGGFDGHDDIRINGNMLDIVQRALRRTLTSEMTGLNRAIPFLATTGNSAPFIGLFGTVWGIMNAFRGIGMKGSATLAVVAPGISEALIATAAGLMAAIPAVIAYNYFLNRVDVLNSEMEAFSSDFLNLVERQLCVGKSAA